MNDHKHDTDRFIEFLTIATVLSVSVLWNAGIVSFESAMIALVTMVLLVLVVR